MRLDVVYSSAADCCYTRTTSYLYAFVIDEPLLRLRAPAVDLSQPAPAAGENALAAKETVFDVESDEETPTLPLPKLDPGRDVGEMAA